MAPNNSTGRLGILHWIYDNYIGVVGGGTLVMYTIAGKQLSPVVLATIITRCARQHGHQKPVSYKCYFHRYIDDILHNCSQYCA
jgi:hypothetical protein